MPIKGLTDSARSAFPSLGKLRKGGESIEKVNAKGQKYSSYGPELTYWRFTSERPEIEAAFLTAYGDEPTEIEVLLPYAKVDDNFSVWKEKWTAGGLEHRCDGETTTIIIKSDGTYSHDPVPCPGKCKEVGRLNVILPDLLRAGFVGYVTAETHSVNDILSILGTLRATVEARGREDVRGIMFMLRRVTETISTPAGDGKRARRQKCMVKLVPAVDWVQAHLEQAQREALPGSVPMLEAPEADYDGDDDDGVIDGRATEIGPKVEAPATPGNGNGKAEPKTQAKPWYTNNQTIMDFKARACEHYGLTFPVVDMVLGDIEQHPTMADAKAALDDYVREQAEETGEAYDGADALF